MCGLDTVVACAAVVPASTNAKPASNRAGLRFVWRGLLIERQRHEIHERPDARGQLVALRIDGVNVDTIQIDVTAQTLRSRSVQASFELMPRHWRMFLEGLDNIGLSLTYRDQIDAFARAHWTQQPWLRDVAAMTKQRL